MTDLPLVVAAAWSMDNGGATTGMTCDGSEGRAHGEHERRSREQTMPNVVNVVLHCGENLTVLLPQRGRSPLVSKKYAGE
jgi:hypothetical protein